MALFFLSVHLSLVALEAAWTRWRRVGEAVAIWASGPWCTGGLVLVARRRASPCSRRDAPVLYQCLSLLALLLARRGAAWRGVAAWHVAWRVSAVQALGAAGLKRGAGLTLKMKTRVDARLLVAPRGATCWYGSTHASYGVRFSSTNNNSLTS